MGTREGNRTLTTLLLLDFESSASTSSATRANGGTNINRIVRKHEAAGKNILTKEKHNVKNLV